MSESDEDVFASYGTLLEPYNDDEIPKKKAFNIEDQVATDAQGRRRFHGAFTGGFSAGFFNTVGSLEGWRPAEFKSSRAEKAERKLQKASDFMDEEDLGEFGIAPTQVRATSDYAPAQVRKRVMKPEGPIPGVPVLHSFLQPAKDTVGIKLLKKMGWKPGQGIGPRLSKAEKLKANREHRMNAGRVYGCEIPEEFLQKVLEEEESSEDETELTFAPDDYDPFIYQPKDNSFGMGYSGLDKRPILSGHVALFADFEMKDRNNKKISISGQAFGVGAFEHEDEDIYTKDDMTKYDFEMDTPSKSKKKSPKKISQSSEKILDGFVIARVSIAPKKAFVPPVLPKNFIPKHGVRISRFEPLPETHKLHNYDRKKTMGRHDLTATQRSKIINSDSNKSIVTNKDFLVGNIKTSKINLEISKNTIERTREFALANTSTIDLNKGGVTTIKEFVTAKLDISNTNSELNKNPIETPNKIVIANISATINKKSVTSQEFVSATLDTSVVEENKSLLEKASKITSTLPSTSTNVFKPFITNPDKQKRYEQYQSFIKLGQREKLSEIQPASLSDWEKEHERYEFEQAARLYRPQTGLIFNKFVAATEQEDINNPLKRLGKSIFEHGTQEIRDAAKMKMFGHLTREIEVWIPHKILCKRFNIPEPEISDVEMLQSCKKKKGKFSVFDYYEAHQQNKIIKEGPEPRKQPEQSDNIPNPDNKDPLIPSSTDTNNILTTNTDNKSNSMQILELEPKLNTDTQHINTFANIDIPSTSSYLEDLFTAEPTEQIPMPVTEPNVVQKIKLPEPKIVIPADPKAKLDLFKAIFLSSSESEGETEEKPKTDRDKIVELKKIVLDEDNLTTTSSKRETKPNKGIFADLDWSQVNRNRSEDKMKKPEPEVKKIIDDNSYGPKLPVINPEEAKAPIWKPSFTKVKTANEKICISSDDEWMEIGSEKSNKKSNKKHKKHKSEKSKEKSKHKKHKSKHKKKKHSDKD